MAEGRSRAQRKTDTLTALEANRDAWLATADPQGRPHLIAVSVWWNDAEIVIATVRTSRTGLNLEATRLARLAFGSPEDVIMVDAKLSSVVPGPEAGSLGDGFARAAGWDPREIDPSWSFYRLTPSAIQAYRGYGELKGREVMKAGRWLA